MTATEVATAGVAPATGPSRAAADPARFWWWFAGLGAVALAVRLANVLWWRPLDQGCSSVDGCFAINGDALYSHLQGELLAQGHGFASSFAYWLFGDLQPGAGDPPLYVVYLGLVSALHGSGGGGARLLALLVLAGAVAASWALGRRAGDRRRVPLATALTATAAVALLVVSVVPGFGEGDAGVHRPEATQAADAAPGADGGEGPDAAGTLRLPDGTEVPQLAVLDLDAVTAHRLASGLAGTVGVLLLGLVARRLAGDRAALVVVALGAVHPLLWINDAMVLSEALYVPTTALVLLAAYRFWDRPGVAEAAWFGGAVALAGLTRAEGLLFGPLIVLPLAWGRREQLGGLRVAAQRVVVAGGVVAVLIAPWLVHNLLRFEEPTFMTAGTGAVLSAGSCDVAYDGEHVGYYGANCFDQYVSEGWVEWPSNRAEESVRDVPSRRAATRYIREHLGELPRVAAFRIGRMWQVYKPAQDVQLDYAVEGRGRWASWAGLVGYAVLAPLAVAGVVLLRRRGTPISPLVAPAVAVTLTAALTFGVTRYRVPADAAMVVAAAVAVDALLGRVVGRSGRRLSDGGAGGSIPAAGRPPTARQPQPAP